MEEDTLVNTYQERCRHKRALEDEMGEGKIYWVLSEKKEL
jgi:hypothetical protein